MPSDMIPCPHCGTANSAKKQVCYHCQAKMQAPARKASPSEPARPLAAKVAPAPPAPRTRTTDLPPQKRMGSYSTMDYIIGVSLRRRAQFFRQMYSLLHSGIPIGLALHYVTDNCAIQMRRRLRQLTEHVQGGGAMSEGMRRYPGLFAEWEANVVLAAEKSGALPQAMHSIAESQEQEWDLRLRVNTATLHLKITAVIFILVFAIVRSVQPGTFTEVLGSVGSACITFALIMLGYIVVKQLWKIFGRTRPGGRVVAALIPRLPLFGAILRDLARVRFVRVLGSLWHAGVAPLEALETAARTTENYHLMRQVKESSGRFGKGATLSSIIISTKFLPQESIYLLQTGENTGDITGALEKIAEYFAIDLEARAKTLPIKLQMIMYAILVPAVLWLAISVYGGYFNGLMNLAP